MARRRVFTGAYPDGVLSVTPVRRTTASPARRKTRTLATANAAFAVRGREKTTMPE
jgi:hypothetical protein